jgi:Ca2+/H+ antiporter
MFSENVGESIAFYDQAKAVVMKQYELIIITVVTGLTMLLDVEGDMMEAFAIGCIAICYLAKYTGDTMESLCEYIPSRLVGLISAFLGNVPEAVTNGVALSKNIDYFILLALIGGCIANGLILMGTCIVASESYFPGKELEDRPVHLMNMGIFAAMSLLLCLPSMVASMGGSPGTVMGFSYFIDIVLLGLYLYVTWFQLTYEDTESGAAAAEYEAVAGSTTNILHAADVDGADLEANDHAADGDDDCVSIELAPMQLQPGALMSEDTETGNFDDSAGGCASSGSGMNTISLDDDRTDSDEKEDEEETEPMWVLIAKLIFAVVCIGFASDVVTGTIEEKNKGGKLPVDFMIFAVVGIVGNVPEHYSAMYMSITKGDLSLAYATSFGSSGQLIGLILPLLSLLGGIRIMYTAKYLLMLQLSWIVPLYLVYFKQHSLKAGWVLCAMYLVCAILSAY